MLTGQNGILNRAAEAKEKTEDKSDIEYLQMKAYDSITNYHIKGEKGSETEYVLEELGKIDGVTTNVLQSTVEYNGKIYDISEIMGNTNEQKAMEKENGLTQITAANVKKEDAENNAMLSEKDADGKKKIRMIIEENSNNKTIKAVIPAGFYYVTGKPSTGLVISDVYNDDDNNSKGGNQFVWVPCDGENLMYKRHIYNTKNINDEGKYIEDTGNNNWITYYYRNYDDWRDSDTESKSESVNKYKGFYVARYEAGVPSNAPFYVDSAGSEYTKLEKDTAEYKPVSKKNAQSWNYIRQITAKTVSEKMYDENSIKSYLIDGHDWDTIVEWMEKDSEEIGKNSIKYGNYNNSELKVINALYAKHISDNNKWIAANSYQKGDIIATKYTELATGATIAKDSINGNKINNIYDMAGNVWEWTDEIGKHGQESSEKTFAVRRGGSFIDKGEVCPISHRYGENTIGAFDFNIGFRVVLYITL